MAKKEFSRLGLMFLAGTAAILGAQTLVGMLVKLWRPEWLEDPTMNLVLSVMPMYLLGMPVLIGLVKTVPAAAPEKRKMKVWQFLLAMVMCYSVMYLSNLVGTAITGILGLIKGAPIENAVVEIATNANMAVTFFYMVICAPILEEYVFRKLIIDRTLQYGAGAAILLSGLMFGLFHGNISQFVYAGALGMFFAFIYVKTGNIKITIGLHAFINFMGAMVSVLLLKAIRYEEFLEVSATGDMEELMTFVMSNPWGWLAYVGYVGLIMVMVVAGIVLMIVFRKRFVIDAGTETIPWSRRLAVIFLNFGMAAYCIFWLAMMIVQIFR